MPCPTANCLCNFTLDHFLYAHNHKSPGICSCGHPTFAHTAGILCPRDKWVMWNDWSKLSYRFDPMSLYIFLSLIQLSINLACLRLFLRKKFTLTQIPVISLASCIVTLLLVLKTCCILDYTTSTWIANRLFAASYTFNVLLISFLIPSSSNSHRGSFCR